MVPVPIVVYGTTPIGDREQLRPIEPDPFAVIRGEMASFLKMKTRQR